jgi:soluble lytic murein transglycosylase-like protein
MRYPHEPWHYGFTLNPRSTPRAAGTGAGDGERGGLPDFVPARFAPAINAAAQRWSVSATLLAAQLYAESGFNPFAVSPAGARGIAQFMPGTARGMGLKDPFDPHEAIDAQAHLMRDLLRQFGAVPLALAAYNAGPAPVASCGCVPPFPETRGYVARILGLMSGAGEPVTPGAAAGLAVRLVD